ncbi:MAG: hypothetical protein KatS3mg122_0820 [Caldimonas sp.]|nr:MAG: hypothetical protein KatS3mg122_0820 [Caldimonas sp.]
MRRLDGLVARAIEGHPSLGHGARPSARRLGGGPSGGCGWRAAAASRLGGHAPAVYPTHGMVPPPLAGSMATSATLQLSGAWEIDFFGRHRAALQAALGQVRAAQAEAAAAQLLLTSQVAQTYVQLARLLAQQEVAQRALAQRETVLQLIRQRVGGGAGQPGRIGSGRRRPCPRCGSRSKPWTSRSPRRAMPWAALTVQPPEALARLAPASAGVARAGRAQRDSCGLAGAPARSAGRARAGGGGRAGGGRGAGAVLSQCQFGGLCRGGVAGAGPLAASRQRAGTASVRPFDCRSWTAGACGHSCAARPPSLDAAVEAYNAALLDALRETADQITALGRDPAATGPAAPGATGRRDGIRAGCAALNPRRAGHLADGAVCRNPCVDAAPACGRSASASAERAHCFGSRPGRRLSRPRGRTISRRIRRRRGAAAGGLTLKRACSSSLQLFHSGLISMNATHEEAPAAPVGRGPARPGVG